jgi:hypothetical protein
MRWCTDVETEILRAGIRAFEVRYAIREPEPSRRVWKAWEFPFSPRLDPETLYDWLAALPRFAMRVVDWRNGKSAA